jgi:hypothetical protein
MPPRKPKSPPRKKAQPKKATPKKSSAPLPGVAEPRIVSATGSAAGSHPVRTGSAEALEKKMATAVLRAHEDGITDPEHQKAYIQAAIKDHNEGGGV